MAEHMLVRLEGVSKAFGPKEVFKNISLQINDNDRTALVGPNGAGKTTLLRMINGEVRPDSGELTVRTNKIVYLSQFPSFDTETTVNDALAVGRTSESQKRIDELETILTSGVLPPGGDWNEISSEYALLQEEAGGQEMSDAERAMEHLKTFGIDDRLSGKMAELSGGERTKVMLAQVLSRAEKADLLILDEPTNHLDIDAVEWLEDYLMKFKGAVLIVSHDRYFLDRTVTQVYEIDSARLRHYSGNYSQFVDKKAMEMERQQREYDKNVRERERQAKVADEQHRMLWFSSTHKTRLKMLERMEVKEAPDKKRDLTLDIAAAQKAGKNVIIARKLKVVRGKRTIFDELDMDIDNGDKIGLFGPNGAGKTTLIKAILGDLPHRGELWVAPGARIGYFAQGQDLMDPQLTALEQVNKSLVGEARARARAFLYRFMLSQKDLERPISTFSGGERARVGLSLLLSSDLNFLVLDEPTNYLDLMAKHAVEVALAEYPGTFLIVTHDRYLLDSVCSEVAELRNGTLTVYPGSYTEYKGARPGREVVEEAEVYKVLSGFTDWATRTKYAAGDRLLIAPSEKQNFQWALDNGKLRRFPGKERKIVTQSPPPIDSTHVK
jgi:ATP-binding cassette, subfamily F, member 3